MASNFIIPRTHIPSLLCIDERFKLVAEGNATEPLLKQALLAALQSLLLLVDRLVHLHERGTKLPAGGPFTAEKLHIMEQKRESSEQIGEHVPEFDRPQMTLSTVHHEPLMIRCALVFGLAFQPILYRVALGSMMSQDLVYCTNCWGLPPDLP